MSKFKISLTQSYGYNLYILKKPVALNNHSFNLFIYNANS